MKLIFSICLLFIIPDMMWSQVIIKPSDSIYKEVLPNEKELGGFSLIDNWPLYPGGKEGIERDIQNELKYPEKAKRKKIEGKVILSYVVETDGNIGEVKVLESNDSLFSKEAIRVINLLKKWKPAVQEGHPVKFAYEQVFNFNLGDK